MLKEQAMANKRYIDVYGCEACPVSKYCGTMIQSTRLCRSYQESDKK